MYYGVWAPRRSSPVLRADLDGDASRLGNGALHHLSLIKAQAPPPQPRQRRGQNLLSQPALRGTSSYSDSTGSGKYLGKK